MIEFDNEGRSVSCLAFSVFFPVLSSRGFFFIRLTKIITKLLQ